MSKLTRNAACLVALSILLIYTFLPHKPPRRPPTDEEIKKVLHLPRLAAEESSRIRAFLDAGLIDLAEQSLSDILQGQITQIQRKSCDTPHLQCGHEANGCGFACQVHHGMACLIMSYVTGLPLIHTVNCDGWLFEDRWSDVFQPLGSDCRPGPNTFVWWWGYGTPKILDCANNRTAPPPTPQLPYVLSKGIPVDAKMVELIEKVHPDPFLWFVGQFAMRALRLNDTFKARVEEWRKEIGWDRSSPIVGIQVRLSDKINEANDSRHGIEEYMTQAEAYFRKLEASQNLMENSIPRKIYVASDNSSILEEVVEMYPDWTVLGFQPSFSDTFEIRRNGLVEIVRDVLFLSECDHVICGFSSNVCRLIYEVQNTRFNASNLVSLDGDYVFDMWLHYIPRDKLWKL